LRYVAGNDECHRVAIVDAKSDVGNCERLLIDIHELSDREVTIEEGVVSVGDDDRDRLGSFAAAVQEMILLGDCTQ